MSPEVKQISFWDIFTLLNFDKLIDNNRDLQFLSQCTFKYLSTFFILVSIAKECLYLLNMSHSYFDSKAGNFGNEAKLIFFPLNLLFSGLSLDSKVLY